MTDVERDVTYVERDVFHVERDVIYVEREVNYVEDDVACVERDVLHVEDDVFHVEDDVFHVDCEVNDLEDDVTYVERDAIWLKFFSDPAVGSVMATPNGSVDEAIQTFQSAFAALVAALVAALPEEPPKSTKQPTGVSKRRLLAIPLLSELLARYPFLSGEYTSDDIDALMADAASCVGLSQVLTNANAKVVNAARIRRKSAWQVASTVYATAEKKAESDTDVARDLVPIQALLALGPREDTAPVAAVKAEIVATKATGRATRATKKSSAKTAVAAKVQKGGGKATE